MRITQTQSGQSFSVITKGQSEQSDTPFTIDLDQLASGPAEDGSVEPADVDTSNTSASTLSAAFWNMSGSDAETGTSVSTVVPSTSTAVASDSGTASLAANLADEFTQLADMTPAERIRAQYLQSHHLTEAQFDALPQSEQDGINQEIAKQVQRQLGGSDGKSSANSGDDGRSALDI